jgi:cytochrome b561
MSNVSHRAAKTSEVGPTYTSTARRLHWWTVALLLVMFPLGFGMHYRAYKLGGKGVWDGLTDALYTSHKAIGFLVLLLVVARLAYRLMRGAPADEPTLEPWQKLASHVTHGALYVLLLVVPLLGLRGVSQYGARNIYGPISLPPIAAEADAAASGFTFWLHWITAVALLALIGAHVGAALFHHFIRKDGVLQRMLPLRRRNPS